MDRLFAQFTPYFTQEVVTVAIAALFAIASLSLVYAVASINIRAKRQRKERLDRAASRSVSITAKSQGQLLRKTTDGGKMENALARLLPKPDRLRERLAQTGRKITPGQFTGAVLLCGFLSFILIWRLIGLAPLTSLVLGIAAGLILPNMYIGRLIERRRNRFLDNLADGVDVMVRGLKAGLPVSETVNAVAQEAVSPVKEIFADVADRVRMGAAVDEAILKASAAIAAPELKFLSISLSVQKETGGNLAETLENLSEILRKRRQMKLKVKAVSSEARASATILGSLPFVMFGILFLVNRDYVMELFIDPRGHILLGVGLISMMIGVGVMMKMVKFEI